MKINHLLCARLTTNLTLFVFILFALGVMLWTSDEFLNWNILPDWIDKYAQLIIVIFGIFAFLLVVSSLLCSLMVLAEFAAQKVGIQTKEFRVFTRKKLTILAIVIIGVLVTFFAFHKIDKYREESRLAKNRVEFKAKLEKQSKELGESLSHLVTRFPDKILQEIESKTVLKEPAEGEEDELKKLLGAISSSLSQNPSVVLLVPANPPYKYCQIGVYHSHYEYGHNKSAFRQFFLQFPDHVETEVIDALFLEKIKPLKASLKGHFIDNSDPSVWGILKYRSKVVALIYLEGTIGGYGRVREKIFHSGPKKLISN
jgi:hypothetical protein